MWFNRKKKDHSSHHQTQVFEWHSTRSRAGVPIEEGQKQLTEAAVSRALQIPLSHWKKGTLNAHWGYSTITENGAALFLMQEDEGSSYGSHAIDHVIFIDGELITKYEELETVEYTVSEIQKHGYDGVKFVFNRVNSYIQNQEQERNRPEAEAAMAEYLRKQAEEKALEAKKINDTLRRL